jgi:hypothetical protein
MDDTSKCVWCGNLQNTQWYRVLYGTLHFLPPLIYSSCRTSAAVQSEGLNWPMIAVVYLRPSNLFFWSRWSGMGWTEGGKLPDIWIRFHMRTIQKSCGSLEFKNISFVFFFYLLRFHYFQIICWFQNFHICLHLNVNIFILGVLQNYFFLCFCKGFAVIIIKAHILLVTCGYWWTEDHQCCTWHISAADFCWLYICCYSSGDDLFFSSFGIYCVQC